MKKSILITLAIVVCLALAFIVARRTGALRAIVFSLSDRNTAGLMATSNAASNASGFVVNDVQVGDPKANYANVEVIDNYPYLVWLDQKGRTGTMWHCGINPDTGDLIPADCRGFKAFESTPLNRANIGADNKGAYFVGADPQGNIKLVRPTGPGSGTITTLSTPPDTRRRAFYASVLPRSDKQYILWVMNSDVAGIGNDSRNTWVELQYIDVADPTNIHVVERQSKQGRRFAPMDTTVARWVEGRPAIMYGAYASSGRGQDIKEYNVETRTGEYITNDHRGRIDLYPFIFNGQEVIPTTVGINDGQVLVRPSGSTGFVTVAETISVPQETTLQKPGTPVSYQQMTLGGKAYAAYQINDTSYTARGDSNIYIQSLGQPGEIWLTTLLASPQQQWLVSGPERMVRTEPEPFTGTKTAWVFYSATELGAANPFTAHWQLRRAATPVAP